MSRVDEDTIIWRIATKEAERQPRKFKLVSSKAAGLQLSGKQLFSLPSPLQMQFAWPLKFTDGVEYMLVCNRPISTLQIARQIWFNQLEMAGIALQLANRADL